MEREALQEKLEQESLEATWHALAPHASRDALILVSRSLSLGEVGAAVALDDTAAIGGWMEALLLRKPALEQQKAWLETPRKLFRMVIVQPFVLIHELTEEEEALIFETKKQN